MKKRDAKIIALEYSARAIKSFLKSFQETNFIGSHYSDDCGKKIIFEMQIIRSNLLIRAANMCKRDQEKWNNEAY